MEMLQEGKLQQNDASRLQLKLLELEFELLVLGSCAIGRKLSKFPGGQLHLECFFVGTVIRGYL
jgi:hypothetical protein